MLRTYVLLLMSIMFLGSNLVSAQATSLSKAEADGSVVAIGRNAAGQCDVASWQDIVAITAGYDYTVGVKKDGTVVTAGGNWHGRCDVNSWNLSE